MTEKKPDEEIGFGAFCHLLSGICSRYPSCCVLTAAGRGLEAVLDLALDRADLIGVGLEVEGPVPLELRLRLAPDPPVSIAEMVVQHRILGLQLDRALEVADALP